jgi:hypothetical protein
MASAGERVLVRMVQTHARLLLGRQAYRVVGALWALHGSTTAHPGSRRERLQQAPTRSGVLAMLYVPEGADPGSLLRTSRSRFTGH